MHEPAVCFDLRHASSLLAVAPSCYHLLLHYLFPDLSTVCFSASVAPFVAALWVFMVIPGCCRSTSSACSQCRSLVKPWYTCKLLSCRKALTCDVLLCEETHIYSWWTSKQVILLMHFQNLCDRMHWSGIFNFCCHNSPDPLSSQRHSIPGCVLREPGPYMFIC